MKMLPSTCRIFLLNPAESFDSGKICHRIHIIYHFGLKNARVLPEFQPNMVKTNRR